MRCFKTLLVAGLLVTGLPACQTVAAARPGPALAANVLPAKDRAEGSGAYKEIVAQFGGTVGGPVADYVRRVGLKVALKAVPDSRASDWTITILDSPVPNAMATPGGYLYITRGLLAMINSEAELASVLGHEAGHVAGRHTSKRNSRATIATIGTLAAAILGGGDLANVVNTGGQAWVSGYSRSQENDADARGLDYAAKAGYDPQAAATMLESLGRIETVEGKQEKAGAPSIFATHPVTAERVARVRQLAARMPKGGIDNHNPYLTAINGLAYGDAVDQGSVSGTHFRHGGLKLAFDAPPGFTLDNQPDAVRGQAKNGANFVFTGVGKLTPAEAVDAVWRQLGSSNYQSGNRTIHGLPAVLSEGQGTVSGRRVDVGVAAYRFPDGQTYVFRTVAPQGQSNLFEPLYNSVRPLTAAETKSALEGLRIRVVTVGARDTAQTLAARMAPPYNSVARFLALNGLSGDSLKPGEEVKLIVR